MEGSQVNFKSWNSVLWQCGSHFRGSDGRSAAYPLPAVQKESRARTGGFGEDKTAEQRGEGEDGQTVKINIPPWQRHNGTETKDSQKVLILLISLFVEGSIVSDWFDKSNNYKWPNWLRSSFSRQFRASIRMKQRSSSSISYQKSMKSSTTRTALCSMWPLTTTTMRSFSLLSKGTTKWASSSQRSSPSKGRRNGWIAKTTKDLTVSIMQSSEETRILLSCWKNTEQIYTP